MKVLSKLKCKKKVISVTVLLNLSKCKMERIRTSNLEIVISNIIHQYY